VAMRTARVLMVVFMSTPRSSALMSIIYTAKCSSCPGPAAGIQNL
jgi:hypothetical protein